MTNIESEGEKEKERKEKRKEKGNRKKERKKFADRETLTVGIADRHSPQCMKQTYKVCRQTDTHH